MVDENRDFYDDMDEDTSASGGNYASSEISFSAQEFYRVLELAVADALPEGQSHYKTLKIKDKENDLALWDVIEREIASQIASWPEWFAILNQGQSKKKKSKAAEKPGRSFSRYSKIKKTGGTVPETFNAFDERFKSTAEAMSQFALDNISNAIIYSVTRFESHPDYLEATQSLRSSIVISDLEQVEEALPLLDAWQPSRMVEEEVIPEIMERISDEVEELKTIRYPYDGEKPCFWNLALIIRIQVQLLKTLRDRVSRLIASAESQFQSFFVNEIMRAEILPLVRSCLNDSEFLSQLSGQEVTSVYNTGGSDGEEGTTEEIEEEDSEPIEFESDSDEEETETQETQNNKEEDDFEEW